MEKSKLIKAIDRLIDGDYQNEDEKEDLIFEATAYADFLANKDKRLVGKTLREVYVLLKEEV